ncbi:MAG: hypothetical protein WAV38_19485, partial [Xanthobacteraceae bacterium]
YARGLLFLPHGKLGRLPRTSPKTSRYGDLPHMGGGSQIMRMLIVTLSAALMLLSIVPQAGAAKSHLKCGGDNLQCGNLAKVCNPKNGKCCCLSYSRGIYH